MRCLGLGRPRRDRGKPAFPSDGGLFRVSRPRAPSGFGSRRYGGHTHSFNFIPLRKGKGCARPSAALALRG